MATILQGSQTVLGTVSAVQSAQRVIDMADEIALLEPDAAPLTAFTRRMKTGREAFNPEIDWLEDVLTPKVIADSGSGFLSTDTTINLIAGQGAQVCADDVIKNPATGELILVSSISTDALTVVRAFGVTAAAAGVAGQTMLIVGNANQENDTIRTIIATQTVKKVNYCQIFRTPFGFSRTLRDSKLYGGNYKVYESKKKGIEHRVEMERSFLFGEPYAQTNNASGRWATGGLDYWIQTNRINAGGTLSYASLVDLAQVVFRYGNQKNRWCLCAPVAISRIDMMAQERLFHQTTTEVFGVRLTRVQTSHGDLMLVKHPLLQETNAYNERMFVLDMDKILERPFVNANTKLRQNIQTPSADGEQHEYLTQIGIQVENEVTHALLYNIA